MNALPDIATRHREHLMAVLIVPGARLSLVLYPSGEAQFLCERASYGSERFVLTADSLASVLAALDGPMLGARLLAQNLSDTGGVAADVATVLRRWGQRDHVGVQFTHDGRDVLVTPATVLLGLGHELEEPSTIDYTPEAVERWLLDGAR